MIVPLFTEEIACQVATPLLSDVSTNPAEAPLVIATMPLKIAAELLVKKAVPFIVGPSKKPPLTNKGF